MAGYSELRLIVAFLLLGIVATAMVAERAYGQKKTDLPDDAVEPLKPADYRVKVEPIVEPPGEMAVYRIRIWTSQERPVLLLFGQQTDREGVLRAERDKKHYRADFVLTVILRDERPNNEKLPFEVRAVAVGDPGITTIIDDVQRTATLKNLIKMPEKVQTSTLGATTSLGTVGRHSIKVIVK